MEGVAQIFVLKCPRLQHACPGADVILALDQFNNPQYITCDHLVGYHACDLRSYEKADGIEFELCSYAKWKKFGDNNDINTKESHIYELILG